MAAAIACPEEDGTKFYENRQNDGNSQPILCEEVEELDDKEFEIPPVGTPPTLESILYETDSASISDDDFAGNVGLFHETADSASLTSTSSLDSKGFNRDRNQRPRRSIARNVHGSILRQFILKGVSSQLVSAAERVHAGKPTAMAVHSLIAVGTSQGVILVFDAKQVLKWCFGATSTVDQYGSVSSLCFNHSCTRLLCGFAKGQITMWDVTSGKILRTITDAHPLGTAVLHIQFTDDPTLAVCSDSGGSVFELNFKRVMTVRGCDSRCIFSGSRGEVVAIQVLNMIHLKDHKLKEVCIIAMATLSKVIVVSIRPELKVLFTHPLKAKQATLPILFWQFVVIQVSADERVVDPVLSFGRESVLHFFQVSASAKDRIQFLPLPQMQLSYVCTNFIWVNCRTLVVLDETEHLHVVDVRTREELEVLDLANVQLVYGSSHYKGLATGGNVSEAMALAGDRACYQSVTSLSGQLLLLGTKAIHVLMLRTWSERIDQLAKQHRYAEALALALSFYEDRAKAVVGLVNKKGKKKIILSNKMLELLHRFVDFTMVTVPDSSKVDSVEEHFLDSVPLCIEYCIILHRSDIIFGRLHDEFASNPIGRFVFLESLEQHILNGSLVSMSPVVLHEFVEHYESKALFQELESCIVHLNIDNLDLHQVITLCWTHKLYDAIIYIYAKGMADFTTPFQDLMGILQTRISEDSVLSSDIINLGNKLLVYTSCCLSGRAYPMGVIPTDQKTMVKTEIFRCLTLLHTRNALDDEPPYPYLRTLLRFDTRELLNVMALAFEEPEFTKDAGLFQKQRLVDILLQIMVDGEGFTPLQVGALFTFLARQLAKPDNAIVVNRSLFEQVLEYLTNFDEFRHAERQQALLELLDAGGLQHCDMDRILLLCDKAQFFQVCELLYLKRREFHKILSCHLRDSSRKFHVFDLVERHLKDTELTSSEKKLIECEITEKMTDLISIDGQKAVRMIANCFPERFSEILDSIKDKPELQFKLLEGLFDCREGSGSWTDAIYVDMALQEHYIHLMCRYAPFDVSNYLRAAENYRLETILQMVKEFGIRDAITFLLEKIGDIHGAFALMLENFQASLRQFCDEIPAEDADESKGSTLAMNSLSTIVKFCQRNSPRTDESEREAMWFQLLETMLIQMQLQGERAPAVQQMFKEFTGQLLNSMMGYTKLPTILQRIIKDPNYQNSRFGEMKELLLGMLESYNYEITLMSTTRNMVNDDLHNQLVQLKRVANCGYASCATSCGSCERSFDQLSVNEVVILFRCGHQYHEKCLKTASVKPADNQWTCLICCQNNRQSKVRERRISEHVSPKRASPGKSSTGNGYAKEKLHLDPEQLQAVELLKRTLRSPSSLRVLEELTQNRGAGSSVSTSISKIESDTFQRDSMRLRLSPPRNKPLPDNV